MYFHFSPKIENVIEPSVKKLVFITYFLQSMKNIVYSMYVLSFISFYFEYSIFLYFPGKEVKIYYIFFNFFMHSFIDSVLLVLGWNDGNWDALA